MLRILGIALLVTACAGSRPDADEPSADEALAVAREAKAEAARVGNQVALLRAELGALRAQIAAGQAAEVAAVRPEPRPRRNRPDPAATYAVPVGDAAWVGTQDAEVTIVEAFEFACPFCERSRATMDTLLADYEGDIKIVYRHFIVHPQKATEPALAACAAQQQGKYEAMAERIWSHAYAPRDFSRKNLERIARKVGLNMRRFRRDRDGACPERIKADQLEMARFGVTGTPAFFINGRFLSGAQPVEQFRALVDEELAKAKQRIADDPSTTPANYYETHVVGAGLTSAVGH